MLGIRNNQKGISLILITLLVLMVIFAIVISISILTYNQQKMIRNIIKSSSAYYTAEAGIEDSLYRIIKGKKYEATNTLIVGQGLAFISISEESNSKIVLSTGQISERIRKLKAIVKTDTAVINFRYGAQVDQGGLKIQPNAQVIGNVYSNGSIKGGGSTSIITGDAWVAGGIAPEPDSYWTVYNSDYPFGLKIGKIYYLDTAQSFVPSQSKVLNKVSFYLKKVGSPPDQTIRILTDNNGQPSKTSLTSGTLKSSKVTNNYSWVDVSLDPAVNLSADTTYWMMIDVSSDNNNYWVWGKDSSDGYVLGTGKYTKDWTDTNPSWEKVAGDLNFKIWLGGIINEIDNIKIGVDAHANRILNSNILRDAYYQYIENTTVAGTKYPNSPDPSTKDLPISYAQIRDWETSAEKGGVITPAGGTYTPTSGSSLGPVKINGNLFFPSNGTVIITGPVWVTGKILAENNVIIKLQEGLFSGYPVIADNPDDQTNFGQIEFYNNVITYDSSQAGLLLFISTNKSLDLSNPAIFLHNNINKDKAQSIIFSLNGLIKVENNAKFKEITGYGLYLANNAEIVYEQGLVNANFSSGPGAGWSVKSWQEIQ